MTIEITLDDQRRMVERLCDTRRFPHPAASVSVIETHISFVLLTGTFAYKIKKAVDLGFVDYTRLEQRRMFCAEEMRLNHRLAPQLYLETAPIYGSAAEPAWLGTEAIDYAVKMAQFSQSGLLDRVLDEGRLTTHHVDALAATVAAFHGAVPAAATTDDYGSPAAVWAPVEGNFSHLRGRTADIDPGLLATLEDWARREYGRLRETFAQRKAAGHVRECHGDLHLGNIVLIGDAPVIFDCIEFNPHLRWIDIVNDLAFLVMDLSERGRPDCAWRLVNLWLETLGDHGGLDLLRFYQVYRALVRAKVASIRAADPAMPAGDRQAALALASNYLHYAARTTAPGPRAILITHGLAGSGKSTVARAMAETLGAIYLRSDVERKRMHGLASQESSDSGTGTGLYTNAATQATYTRLAELAANTVAAGYPAIVDATCLKRWQRDTFRRLADKLGVPCIILDCQAPLERLRQRIVDRAKAGGDASEATLAVLERQLRDAEPLSEEEQALSVVFDGLAANLDEPLEQIRQRIVSRRT